MANYYVASNSNSIEGPYSLEELVERFDAGGINRETLVCYEGGSEWVSFKNVYKHYKEEMALENRKRAADIKFTELNKKPAWLQIEEEKRDIEFTELNKKLDEQQETQKSDAELFLELFQTVEGIFRVLGTIALIAGFILLFSFIEDKQPGLGFIYLISGILSCLICFWFAKVLTLLQKIADKK